VTVRGGDERSVMEWGVFEGPPGGARCRMGVVCGWYNKSEERNKVE
jgi:hypothetical protein